MDGGGRVLRSLDGPLAAVGGTVRGSDGRRTLVFRSQPRNLRPLDDELPVISARPRPRNRRWRDRLLSAVGLTNGWVMAFGLFAATFAYGATLGDHWGAVRTALVQLPDTVAGAAGFRITSIAVDGRRALTDREILAALDFGSGRSTLFLDASAARDRLMAYPIVQDAAVRKLYPDKLAIDIVEREPYALWQRNGELVVIASDGKMIDIARDGRFSDLPLVVGRGADETAAEILDVLALYPDFQSKVYAAVRVGDRRWNLRLTNGMDVKLPETGVSSAVARLIAADKDSKLFDRDIVEVDMRRMDRVTVRLSDSAAQAIAEAEKKAAKKGGAT